VSTQSEGSAQAQSGQMDVWQYASLAIWMCGQMDTPETLLSTDAISALDEPSGNGAAYAQ
jgi:hypothetical protein